MDPEKALIAIERKRMVDALLGGGKADVVLKGGKIVSVVSAEIYEGEVALCGRFIVKTGDCENLIGTNTIVYDLEGAYVAPGFIDAHQHFESAMLTATEFTRLSLPTGTTTLVSDPHEVGNVSGPVALKAIAEECATLPTRIHNRVPCRTPDMPGLETAGFDISAKHMPELLELPTVTGIGEIQGVSLAQRVYDYTPEVFDDVIAAAIYARSIGKIVDGNAPGLNDDELAAHIITGGTDVSCHETTTKAECVQKLRNGVYVLMREGSTQKNMAECIRAYLEDGLDSRRLILATDDMLPDDLQNTGHMNEIIRRTIAAGVEPIKAIQMATINPATWFGFNDVGALLPGKLADIVVLKDLESMEPVQVFLDGKEVAKDRKLLIDLPAYQYPDSVKHTIRRGPVTEKELQVKAEGKTAKVNAVGLIVDQNLSDWTQHELPIVDGVVQADVGQDVAHICVVERHGKTNEVGKGFVSGFKMTDGAIAETVSHDTHNLIVMGTNHKDMVIAVNRVMELQGGVVVVQGGEVKNELPLPICGLMTDEYDAPGLVSKMEEMVESVKAHTGVQVHGPFMHLAFLSLATSPKLKITDKGLINVDACKVEPTVIEVK